MKRALYSVGLCAMTSALFPVAKAHAVADAVELCTTENKAEISDQSGSVVTLPKNSAIRLIYSHVGQRDCMPVQISLPDGGIVDACDITRQQLLQDNTNDKVTKGPDFTIWHHAVYQSSSTTIKLICGKASGLY